MKINLKNKNFLRCRRYQKLITKNTFFAFKVYHTSNIYLGNHMAKLFEKFVLAVNHIFDAFSVIFWLRLISNANTEVSIYYIFWLKSVFSKCDQPDILTLVHLSQLDMMSGLLWSQSLSIISSWSATTNPSQPIIPFLF